MRKGAQGMKFPESSLLFSFCLSVLKSRRQTEKVHDQDVGDILGFNPSDTSQWKRGKKGVRNVYALEALSRTLQVDFETLHDLSDGSLDLDEAWSEFLEAEEGRSLRDSLSPGLLRELHMREAQIDTLAEQMLAKAQVSSIPIFLPEIIEIFPFLEIGSADVRDRLAWVSRTRPGQYLIRFRKGEMRAHTRIAVATEIARVLLVSERDYLDVPPLLPELLPLEVRAFAKAMLVPGSVMREEFQRVSPRLNAIKALADVFWVPKFVIRSRLTRLLTENIPDSAWSQADAPIKREFLVREVSPHNSEMVTSEED